MPEPVEVLDWDTAHWGVATGRATAAVSDRAGLEQLGTAARRRSLMLVYVSIPASEMALAQYAARLPGLRLVDIRLVLSRTADPHETPVPLVRWARASDVGELAQLAGVSHTNTRFFADPRLGRDRAADLYRRWIVQCFERDDEDVAVAEVDGRVSGYVTVSASGETARIGLLAVDPAARGRGVGDGLVRWAVRRAGERSCERILVGTQGGSPVAQRLYQRCGFTTESVDLLYHWWLDDLSTSAPPAPRA